MDVDCEKARSCMVEYIEDTLDRSMREEVACHLENCDSCFREIKSIDKTMWNLEESSRNVKIPQGFLYNVDEEILKKYNPRAKAFRKMLKRAAYVFAALFAFLFVVLVLNYSIPESVRYRFIDTVTMGKVYSSSYGTFGKRLNISSTFQNIKVTVEKVAADDMQTIIYFKTEGPGNDKYRASMDSISIKGGIEVWGGTTDRGVQPYRDGFILYLGSMAKDEVNLDISVSKIYVYDNYGNFRSLIEGKWDFKVPVKRIKSISYDINRTVNMDGYDIIFKKLSAGPTGTKLYVYCSDNSTDPRFIRIIDVNLQNGSSIYNTKNITNGTTVANPLNSYSSLTFDAVYPEALKEMYININVYDEYVAYKREVEYTINLDGAFPAEYDYLENKIIIDNLKIIDDEINFEMIEPSKQRSYTNLVFSFEDGDRNKMSGSGQIKDFYMVDQYGTEHDRYDILSNPEKYRDKELYKCPVKEDFTFKLGSKNDKYIILSIAGHYSVKKINKTVQIK